MTIHDRPITPDDLAILDTLPGVLAIGRDQNLCVFWVNGLQEQLSGMKPEEYLGRSLESMMPRSVAEERRRTLEAVLEDNQPRTSTCSRGKPVCSSGCSPSTPGPSATRESWP